MCRKSLLLTFLFAFSCFIFPAPKARACDPVTIALLAPVAIAAAKEAKPYLIKGFQNGVTDMMLIGKDFLEFFYLPLGILKVTAGAPFGYFSSGLKNCVTGGIAPFKMTFHIVMLPVYCTGLISPH
jgi:hypothetical protein